MRELLTSTPINKWYTYKHTVVLYEISIDAHTLWQHCSDVTVVFLISSADEAFDGTYPTNVVVTNTGKCTYIPPGIFKSTCKIDITWFPFDDQDCNMKFGSWTYNGFKVLDFPIVFSNNFSQFNLQLAIKEVF